MTGNSDNILEINSIEVMYDSVISALHDVSLNVPKGKIVALLGGNGAGKSTTLKSRSYFVYVYTYKGTNNMYQLPK